MADQALLQSLQKRLQLLEDKDALATLINRYCKTADDKQWSAFAGCFIPDGELGFENWGPIIGRDKIAAASGGAEDRFQGLQHSMTNMEFVVNGDEATGTCYLWFAATMDTSRPQECHAFGGPYRFDFVRTKEEGWRIKRMRMRKIWAINEDKEGVFSRPNENV